MKIISKDKQDKILLAAGFLLVAFEIILLVYYNFAHFTDSLDDDVAKLMSHAVEMAKHHTFFVDDWIYITTGEFDCTTILAIPLFYITHNIILSFAIGNVINIILWIFTICTLMRKIKQPLLSGLLALGIIFASWWFGKVEYVNMLFFGGGQYVYKTLIPILFIVVLIYHDVKWSFGEVFFVVIYYGLLFISGMSSGIYVGICGIFPIMLCLIMALLAHREPAEKKWMILHLVATICVILFSVYICKISGVSPNSASMELKTLDEIGEDLFVTFLSLTDLFHILDWEIKAAVGSAAGILSLVKLTIFLFILYFGLTCIPRIFGIKTYRDAISSVEEDRKKEFVLTALISIFVWNYFILFMTETTPRYHLMGAFALVLCGVIVYFEKMDRDRETIIPVITPLLVMSLLLTVNLFMMDFAVRDFFHQKDEDRKMMDTIAEQMAENDVEMVFVAVESGLTEKLRVYHPEGIYETFYTEKGIRDYDFYRMASDRAYFRDRNLLVVCKEGYFDIVNSAEFIQKAYVQKYEDEDLIIYLSETAPMDGQSGLPSGGNYSMDLPLTEGYEKSGIINIDGHLVSTDTGVILKSPELEIKRRTCTVSIEYGLQDSAVELFLDIYRDGSKYAVEQMTANAGSISVELPDEGNYTFEIRKETPDKMVNIGSIIFTLR